ncbi:MAG: hypothetical protein ACR2HA_04305, partial [Nocardioides sp.]
GPAQRFPEMLTKGYYFQRVRPALRASGPALGLAICEDEAMGGTVSVARQTRQHAPSGRAGRRFPQVADWSGNRRFVDTATHSWIDTLPWTAYLELVEKMIIAADPRRAETIRLLAATDSYVTTSQSTEHGLKTLIAKANAGQVIYLIAVIDQLADILTTRGDTRPQGPRRATALGILAHPAHALALLTSALTHNTDTDSEDPTEGPDDTEHDEPGGQDQPREPRERGGPGGACSDLAVPSNLDLPADLHTQLRCLPGHIDLDRLLPHATLYVHISADTLTGPFTTHTGTGTGTGSDPTLVPGASRLGPHVAHVEGIGPITLDQAREWLGHHRVTLLPVLDPATTEAVTGYTFTPRLREALHATVPRDVFPWAVNTGRGKDIDHPIPYRPPDTGPPGGPPGTGPPGQTGLHNAAPMTRHHHRLKTHVGWHLTQLTVGTYLWRSPHQHYWIVAPPAPTASPQPPAPGSNTPTETFALPLEQPMPVPFAQTRPPQTKGVNVGAGSGPLVRSRACS